MIQEGQEAYSQLAQAREELQQAREQLVMVQARLLERPAMGTGPMGMAPTMTMPTAGGVMMVAPQTLMTVGHPPMTTIPYGGGYLG